MKEAGNIAFIDGQNLYMGTAKREADPWKIDLARFRVYLQEKYNVDVAYYHLGYISEKQEELYEEIQKAGFILLFKKHTLAMIGLKKGNVDSDIIFSVMKKLYKKEHFKNVVLVSGDGDFKVLVDFLVEEDRFEKILFPNRKNRSSLYKKLGSEYYDFLENSRDKIGYKKEKGSLGN